MNVVICVVNQALHSSKKNGDRQKWIFALKEASGRIATCGRWGLLKARCHFTPVEGLCGEVLIDVFDAGIISSTRFSSGVSWVHVEWKRGASAS